MAWQSYPQDGSGYGIFAQRFASTGSTLGTEFQVNTYTTLTQRSPGIRADPGGNFVVVWNSYLQDGDSFGVFGQRFASTGSTLGTEFQVNTYTTACQGCFSPPGVASDSGGNFVVVWTSYTQDGDSSGVFGQRFAVSTATPTETPTATLTDTPIPTATATDTPVPSATPTDSPSPTVSNTPTPSATVTLSVTPAATSTPTAGVSCPAAPSGSCLSAFTKGLLVIKEDIPGEEKLLVKMVKGPALVQTDFGNPLAPAGTAYAVCVYDGGGALVGSAVVDRAFDLCSAGTKACWNPVGKVPPNPVGKGYRYKDEDLAAQGIAKIKLKGGAAGSSKVIVKGEGANLPDGIPAALQNTTSVTVQLHGSDAPQCLAVTLPLIRKHEIDFFKAKK